MVEDMNTRPAFPPNDLTVTVAFHPCITSLRKILLVQIAFSEDGYTYHILDMTLTSPP